MRKMMGSGPFAFAVDGWGKWRANFKAMLTSASMARRAREMMFKTGDEKALELFDDPRLVFLFGEYDGSSGNQVRSGGSSTSR